MRIRLRKVARFIFVIVATVVIYIFSLFILPCAIIHTLIIMRRIKAAEKNA